MERKYRDEKESLVECKNKTKLKSQVNANTSIRSSKKTNTEPFPRMYEYKKQDTTVRQQPGIVQHYHQYNIVNKNYALFGNSKNTYGPNDDSKKKNGLSKSCGKSCTSCARGLCCFF